MLIYESRQTPLNTYIHKGQVIAHTQANVWKTADYYSKGTDLSQYNTQQTEYHKSITTGN